MPFFVTLAGLAFVLQFILYKHWLDFSFSQPTLAVQIVFTAFLLLGFTVDALGMSSLKKHSYVLLGLGLVSSAAMAGWNFFAEKRADQIHGSMISGLASEWIIFCGILLTCLLLVISYFSDTLLQHAEEIVEEKTKELKNREMEIAATREKYELTMDGAADGFWVWSVQTNEFFFSERWKEILGYSDAEVASQKSSWEQMVYIEDRDRVFESLESYLRKKEGTFKDEYRMVHKDGSLRWILTRGKALWNEQGEVVHVAGSQTDTTSRKKIETDLKIALEKLYSGARAKSAFMSNIFHEILTPMNGITALSTLLLDSELDEVQKKQIQVISESSEAMLDLLNDIFEISRFYSGNYEMVPKNICLEKLIFEVVSLFEQKIQSKKLELKVSMDTQSLTWIKGDSGAIRQVLVKLISNAVRFTEVGSIEVKLRILNIADSNMSCEISVRDTGIGISQQDQKRIFSPFQMWNENSSSEGLGIGLSLAKDLTDLLKGKIEVASILGVGSIFTFSCSCAKGVADGSSLASSSFLKKFERSNAQIKILLINGGKIHSYVTKEYLRKIGFETEEADNGLDALEKCDLKKYDLILLDLQMPLINGFEVVKKIRFNDAKVRVFAFSSLDDLENREQAFLAGVNEFMIKPIQLAELQTMLIRYFPAIVKPSQHSDDLAAVGKRDFLSEVYGGEFRLINLEKSKDLFGQDFQALQKVAVQVLEFVEKQGSVLDKAVTDRDYQRLIALSTDLRGVTSCFFTDKIRMQIEAIEKDYADGRVLELRPKLDVLKEDLCTLEAELKYIMALKEAV